MKLRLTTLLLCATFVFAQLEVDEDLIDTPGTGLDFDGCFKDLIFADTNGDGVVKKSEYLPFINKYGIRRCWYQTELTLLQHSVFNSLACICKQRPGAKPNCCIGENAEIETAGALNRNRSPQQEQYLRQVCIDTDATIDGVCPPVIRPRGTPPPVIISPQNAAFASASGLQDWAKWLLIALAALLLILLCCCCCVIRRRKAREEELEEEDKMAEMEMAPDSAAPNGMGGPAALGAGTVGGAAMTADADSSEEWDEDERKKRGTNFPNPEDEDNYRRFGGEGPLPGGHEFEKVVLRPIEKDEDSDPDWDAPGRNINYPKPEPDEMSAQEFDPYQPDGGVYDPQRPDGAPVGPAKVTWERLKKEEPDEVDNRKVRVQHGLGGGEVWDALDTPDNDTVSKKGPVGDVFDWVVGAALGVLDKTDGQMSDDNDRK